MKARAGVWVMVAVALGISPARAAPAGAPTLTVGSKAFPESWILGEAVRDLLAGEGGTVGHRSNLGGTEIVFAALESGGIDVYPEYTGTIAEVILHAPGTGLDAMRAALARRGIGISAPLGFNDGYALAVRESTQKALGVHRISDLLAHPGLRYGLTHEFLGRSDGFEGLARRYGLHPAKVRGLQHELAYGAIAAGSIDVTDIYTTDAQIARLGLRALEDDRAFFPRYDAVLLYRLDLERKAPRALARMLALTGRVDEARMIAANARVVLDGQPFPSAAHELLSSVGLAPGAAGPRVGIARSILTHTLEHLRLVAISLVAAILIGVPLGILASRARPLAALTLTLAGLLQTIPSLALLAFLIPVFGVGAVPALIALFLYSLLPIVRNTYVGLTTISPALEEAARALALRPSTHLFRVRLPLATPGIMAGVKISAVINVGTATLAALIGAGGLGDPILSGIQLRQNGLILQGALPAAVLALLVQWAFDGLDRIVIPRGLRLPSEPSA